MSSKLIALFHRDPVFDTLTQKPTLRPAKCAECGDAVPELPTAMEYEGQEIHLFHPVLCASCLLGMCQRYSAECANCGGTIPPFSQVGVLKAGSGQTRLVHMTAVCSSVGSAFHGYWGKGRLLNYVQVEAC